MLRRHFLAAAPAIPILARPLRASPVLTTAHGPVVGGWNEGIAVFLGVRYGADTGLDRFGPPRRPSHWSKPSPADAYGASAPQHGEAAPMSEDCLFLNVWTPALDRARRPIMVYVHGGGYATGSGSDPLYDGARLARRRDVVVVTLNHRLGPLGYASLRRIATGFDVSGNAGQLDLILALEWVRDHAVALGGDPSRVMLFGQSGGGAKIATLMAMPAAAGLFHAVATMSGQQVTASGPLNAERRARAWLTELGVAPDGIDAVRRMPWRRLVEASRIVDPILGYGSLHFGPVLDGVSLPRHPFHPDAPPQSSGTPMIIGQTRDETLAFLGADPANAGLTWDSLPGRLTPDQLRLDVEAETVIAFHRALHPTMTPDELLIAATTAGRSWRAALIELEARAAQGAPAWAYRLDLAGALPNGRRGAFHGADIALAFDNVDRPGSPFTGPDAHRVAGQLSTAFATLARSGTPAHSGLPHWPQWRPPERETLILDVDARIEQDPRGSERDFFNRYPYVQPGT
ncbi:carboxylesterase/lipase family protein [Brevundimonas sp.]|jgi:para-nitrobenzyl esterase|uniref:carboxylesterase/lipase family protein n=1 Tax=Brevundimonas sp. TaxID=1871086 RepID=UPI002E0F4E8C|nr:carboxylesterase/lipase family protein [Brevundimonas sp.]